jgi:hypothetical protein
MCPLTSSLFEAASNWISLTYQGDWIARAASNIRVSIIVCYSQINGLKRNRFAQSIGWVFKAWAEKLE